MGLKGQPMLHSECGGGSGGRRADQKPLSTHLGEIPLGTPTPPQGPDWLWRMTSQKHPYPLHGSNNAHEVLEQRITSHPHCEPYSLLLNPCSVPSFILYDLAAACDTLSPPRNAYCYLMSRWSYILFPSTSLAFSSQARWPFAPHFLNLWIWILFSFSW